MKEVLHWLSLCPTGRALVFRDADGWQEVVTTTGTTDARFCRAVLTPDRRSMPLVAILKPKDWRITEAKRQAMAAATAKRRDEYAKRRAA